MLHKLLSVIGKAFVAKSFLANQIIGDRPDPLTKIGSSFEIKDVTVSKHKCFVSDFVDQVGNWQLHCHESTKSGAVDVQQFLKSTEVTIL